MDAAIATATISGTRVFKEKVKARKPADRAISYVNPSEFRATEDVSYHSKRVLDLLFGTMAFFALALLTPFIALGIKLYSEGLVFVKQPRTGKHGHIFFSYKFRTMHLVNLKTDYQRPPIIKKDDKRIFSFGQFLRKMNLDELPQILSVIKGEMSLVGPEPFIVDECEYRTGTFNDHFYRYMLKPGILGYARAHGYRGRIMEEDQMRKQLDFDLTYVEKNSLLFDLKIIYKTLKRKIFGDSVFATKTQGLEVTQRLL